MSVDAIHGDCLDVIPRLVAEGVSVDAVVTDPPYEIGFMAQDWDRRGVAFDPETWRTSGTALKPGGFLVAFGGTRTHHRLACAIEDAGFVVQDCLMWLFATGFPKGRTQLKPAYEPIMLAYKPGAARTMQIDECRIPADGRPLRVRESHDDVRGMWRDLRGENPFGYGSRAVGTTDLGRWPANLCHDGSDEVVALFPQNDLSKASFRGIQHSGRHGGFAHLGPNPKDGTNTIRGHNDSGGSAARFFFSAKAGNEDRFGSKHPTVKPVALMQWLVQLVTPPGGLVLDPFAGSGTTGVAALASGRNAILIEREANWFGDIQARLAFYQGAGRHSLVAKARHRATPHGVMPLFEWPA